MGTKISRGDGKPGDGAKRYELSGGPDSGPKLGSDEKPLATVEIHPTFDPAAVKARLEKETSHAAWANSHNLQANTFERVQELRTAISYEGHEDLYIELIDILSNALKLAKNYRYRPIDVTRILDLNRKDIPRALQIVPCTSVRTEEDSIYPDVATEPNNWLARYIQHVEQSEPPIAYHFWSAIVTLGASLRRNLYIDRGSYELWPAHYAILVGPSGVKKSAAIDTSHRLLDRTNNIIHDREAGQFAMANSSRTFQSDTCHTAQVKILPARASAEFMVKELLGRMDYDLRDLERGLVRKVHDGSMGIIYADEMRTLVGKQCNTGDNIAVFLTDTHGCPDERPIGFLKYGKKVTLTDVSVSLLGGSTPDWLSQDVSPGLYGGGFMPRTLFIGRWENLRSVAWPSPLDPIVAIELAQELANFAMMQTRGMRVPTDAWKWFEDWYGPHRNDKTANPLMQGYIRRRGDHVLRLAMLLGIAGDGIDAELTVKRLEQAWRILEYEEAHMAEAFESLQTHPSEHLFQKAIGFIRKWALDNEGRPMPHYWFGRSLRPSMGTSSYQLEDIVKMMVEQLYVKKVPNKGRGGGICYEYLLDDGYKKKETKV